MVKNVILLDGVGLNLKTSTLQHFKDEAIIVESDSYVRTAEMGNLFPHSKTSLSRIYSKYLSMIQATKYAELVGRELILVDRGISNLIAWYYLNSTEIVDRYVYSVLDDRLLGDNNYAPYVNLENQFNVKRLLITTHNDMILRDGLDESKYESDEHTQQRIDCYYDLDYYQVVQDEYESYYHRITRGDYSKFDITNEFKTYEEATAAIVDKVRRLCLD